MHDFFTPCIIWRYQNFPSCPCDFYSEGNTAARWIGEEKGGRRKDRAANKSI